MHDRGTLFWRLVLLAWGEAKAKRQSLVMPQKLEVRDAVKIFTSK
jgi:hypothetical protein